MCVCGSGCLLHLADENRQRRHERGLRPVGSADVACQRLDHALQVNTRSQLTLIRRAVAHFLDAGGGSLVGLSSWAAQRGAGNANLVGYAASKAATAAALKTVARAYATDGVFAYLIAPGVVDTQMSASAGEDRGGRQAFLDTLTMREMVPPSEIAELVALLAGGRTRHLSGATIDVNGASYIR